MSTLTLPAYKAMDGMEEEKQTEAAANERFE